MQENTIYINCLEIENKTELKFGDYLRLGEIKTKSLTALDFISTILTSWNENFDKVLSKSVIGKSLFWFRVRQNFDF